MPSPLTIGLTGAVAAGKSEALAAFGRLGAEVVSSDALVHELLGSDAVVASLVERWGPEVAPGGTVDRGRIGEIVFADPEQLAWLEGLLHPLVRARIAEWLTGLPVDTRTAVVEVPLLFEGGMAEAFDTTVAVVADDAVRAERAGSRGHARVAEREARQLSQEEKAARAEHVVTNDGTPEELEAGLATLLERLGA